MKWIETISSFLAACAIVVFIALAEILIAVLHDRDPSIINVIFVMAFITLYVQLKLTKIK